MASRARSDFDDDFSIERKRPAYGLLVAVILGVVALGSCGCCTCGVGAIYLLRDDFTNTTWHGTENLAGFGRLTFEFKEKNVAVMRDARGVVQGSWTKQGSNVTIRFANCEYRGTINGNVMTGTAHPTNLGGGGRVWQFNVTRQ